MSLPVSLHVASLQHDFIATIIDSAAGFGALFPEPARGAN